MLLSRISTTYEEMEKQRKATSSTLEERRGEFLDLENVCIGFAWPGFGSWGAAAGVAPVRSCQKLSLCPT